MAAKKTPSELIWVLIPVAALIGVGLFVRSLGKKGKGVIMYDNGPSEFFSWIEVTRSAISTAEGFTDQFILTDRLKMNARYLGQFILDPIRVRLEGPVFVNSWYRSEELNDFLVESEDYQAVENSQHLEADTADVHFNFEGQKRNDLLIRSVLVEQVPFDRMLIEKGTESRPDWVQLEFNSERFENDQPQRGIILRTTNGFDWVEWSRSKAEGIYL